MFLVLPSSTTSSLLCPHPRVQGRVVIAWIQEEMKRQCSASEFQNICSWAGDTSLKVNVLIFDTKQVAIQTHEIMVYLILSPKWYRSSGFVGVGMGEWKQNKIARCWWMLLECFSIEGLAWEVCSLEAINNIPSTSLCFQQSRSWKKLQNQLKMGPSYDEQ